MTSIPRARQNHIFASGSANNKAAQLSNAYQELGKELASDKLKVVGGYTLGRIIGEGTFGSVHLATHRLTGTRCAIKKIPKTSTSQLTREIHHHRRLHHPNIVHLHEIIATESHIWLVTELCSGGELFDYLVERGRMLEGEGRRLFGELTVAVGLMHKQGVVHRDLKLENVLLDGELKIKLGDLGFARECQKGRLMDTFCGTTGYASPEMLAGRKYLGEETDVWSLGIILYSLLCGGLPFDSDDEREMKDLILKGEYDEPDWLSPEARSLIRDMLQQDPSKRLTIEGILSHPWFTMTLIDDIPHARGDTHSIAPSPAASPNPQTSHFPESSHSKLSFSDSSGFLGPYPTSQTSQYPHSTELTQPHEHPTSHDTQAAHATHESLTRPGPSPLSAPPAPQSDTDPSETSHDLFSSEGRPDTGVTTPTSTEEEQPEEDRVIKRMHSGEDSYTEKILESQHHTLEMQHSNTSQTTIRYPNSESQIPRPKPRVSLGKNTLGDGPQEIDEDLENDQLAPLEKPSSFEDHHSHPLTQFSRTPSRTKRRSVSSILSIQRRLSHHSNSGQFQTYPPEDYLSQLNSNTPERFTTPSEKYLLKQMSDLGVDIGQLKHSVNTDACDSSAAMWWILRQKQLVDRGETDKVIEDRMASSARKKDRASAYAREERRKRKEYELRGGEDDEDLRGARKPYSGDEGGRREKDRSDRLDRRNSKHDSDRLERREGRNPESRGNKESPPKGGKDQSRDSSIEDPSHLSISHTPTSIPLSFSGSGSGSGAVTPQSHLAPLLGPMKTIVTSPEPVIPSDSMQEIKPESFQPLKPPKTPPKPDLLISPDTSPSNRLKSRSPSISMLQRATSVLVGGSWKLEDKIDSSDNPSPNRSKPSKQAKEKEKEKEKEDRRSTSPTKLIKPNPKTKLTKSENQQIVQDRTKMTRSDSSNTLLNALASSSTIGSRSPESSIPSLVENPSRGRSPIPVNLPLVDPTSAHGTIAKSQNSTPLSVKVGLVDLTELVTPPTPLPKSPLPPPPPTKDSINSPASLPGRSEGTQIGVSSPHGETSPNKNNNNPPNVIPTSHAKGTTPGSKTPSPNPGVMPKVKNSKRDSLWSTFRYLFQEDRRRRKNSSPGPSHLSEIKVGPALVLSRGIAARAPHPSRLPASRRPSIEGRPVSLSRRASIDGRPVSIRRSSIDGKPVSISRRASIDGKHVTVSRRASVDGKGRRPVISRRSSSVNSRRSSISHPPSPMPISIPTLLDHLPPLGPRSSSSLTDHHHYHHHPLSQNSSQPDHPSRTTTHPNHPIELSLRRHTSGSQTPTSDFESRPSSLYGRDRRPGVLRSPSLHSEKSIFRQSQSSFYQNQPSSPLHNYQRRPTSGSSSRRIKHVRAIPESQIFRSGNGRGQILRSGSMVSVVSISSSHMLRSASVMSVTSSIKSTTSSRNSSRERERDKNESDYETGDNGSIRSKRSLVKQLHKSTLLDQKLSRQGKKMTMTQHSMLGYDINGKEKKPTRDVFKDDDWVDESDEDYLGGIGQEMNLNKGQGWKNGYQSKKAGWGNAVYPNTKLDVFRGRMTEVHPGFKARISDLVNGEKATMSDVHPGVRTGNSGLIKGDRRGKRRGVGMGSSGESGEERNDSDSKVGARRNGLGENHNLGAGSGRKNGMIIESSFAIEGIRGASAGASGTSTTGGKEERVGGRRRKGKGKEEIGDRRRGLGLGNGASPFIIEEEEEEEEE